MVNMNRGEIRGVAWIKAELPKELTVAHWKPSNPEVSLYWAFTQKFLGFQVMKKIPSNYSRMREVCVI